jgi:hypothetical protein
MNYYIHFENHNFPLKRWVRENHNLIVGYVYTENDQTNQIVAKLVKLGWKLNQEKGIMLVSNLNSMIQVKEVESEINIASEFERLLGKSEHSKNFSEEGKYLKMYLQSMQKLIELNVLNTRRDFTSQIGEWLICNLFGGTQSNNGIQKDWDILINEKKIQVKAHSKSKTTTARWTEIKYNEYSDLDYLAIIIFDTSYVIKEFYFARWLDCLKFIKKQKHRNVINWNDLKKFKIDLSQYGKIEVLKLFNRKY